MSNEITLDKIHEILDQCTMEERDTFTDYVVLWAIWLMMVCVAINCFCALSWSFCITLYRSNTNVLYLFNA